MNGSMSTAHGPIGGSMTHGQWSWLMRPGNAPGSISIAPNDGPPYVADAYVNVVFGADPRFRNAMTGAQQHVFDRISWTNPRVRLPNVADSIELPLTFRFMLGAYYSRYGSPRNQATRSNRFPLPTQLQHGVMYIYAYRLDGSSLSPFSDADKARDPMQIIVPDAGTVNAAPNATVPATFSNIVILVATSFAVSDLRNDFEPTGFAWMCRVWPQTVIVANTTLSEVQSAIGMVRPAQTSTLAQMSGASANLGSILCADRNDFHVGLGPPTWNDIFDYVLSTEIPYSSGQASNSESFTAVHHTHLGDGTPVSGAHSQTRVHSDPDLRQVWVQTAGRSNASNVGAPTGFWGGTNVDKSPGQAEFDNIHISPTMTTPVGPASMAPLCAHDCFHMHWRWGNGINGTPQRGFSAPTASSPSLPHAVAGAPAVPRNQDVVIALTSTHGIDYRVTCHGPIPPWSEQILMHHGAAQALHVDDLAEAGITASYPLHIRAGGGYPGFYYYLQYRDVGVEHVRFPQGITALRQL